MKVAILTINAPSFDSALKLAKSLSDFEVTIFAKSQFDSKDKDFELKYYQKLDEALKSAWDEFDAIIAILATGAVVRKVAPLLKDKSTDPAVLVINLALDKIIPLLGGHLGGANELATLLAKRLNASLFISTATDQTKRVAFDMVAKRNGWVIENIKYLANISNRVLNGETIKVATTESIFNSITPKDNLSLISIDEVINGDVFIYPLGEFEGLTLRPKVYIGVGCNRGVSFLEIKEAFFEFIDRHKIDLKDIYGFYSFEAKKDEIGLLEFAKYFEKEITFFAKDKINSLTQEFSPSASKKFFGLKGVAEPTAVLGSKYKELIIKKESFGGKVTFAVAI